MDTLISKVEFYPYFLKVIIVNNYKFFKDNMCDPSYRFATF